MQLCNELKEKLQEERGEFVDEFPSFSMLGCDFVCTDVVIDQLCKKAKCIASLEDMNILFLRLCPENPLPRDVDIDIYKSCDVLSLCHT